MATTKEVFPEIFGNLSFKGGAVVQLQEAEAEAKAAAAANLVLENTDAYQERMWSYD